MPRLKDRNRQTPGGHQFYDPVLKYRGRPWASVDEIAAGLVQARLGNPALTQQHGWSTDINIVANEVDEAIAKHCQQMKWDEFIVVEGGATAPPPFPHTQARNQRLLGKLRNVAASSPAIIEFLKSKEEAVSIAQAESRASVCITCEFNQKHKSWLDIFTTTVSEAIRKGLETFRGWKLPIPHEDKLGNCERCNCPLPLKVYFPIQHIEARMPDDVRQSLPEYCWIKLEGKK